MIVLDTTVLVYAKGDRHRFRDPCRELVAAAGEGRIEATTTAEVIQKFAARLRSAHSTQSSSLRPGARARAQSSRRTPPSPAPASPGTCSRTRPA